MNKCVLLIVAFVALVQAQDALLDSAGVRVALKLYDDCTAKSEGFSPCLKKKALTFLDRLSRMEKLNLVDGVTVVRTINAVPSQEPVITEEQLETSLPRAVDARDAALNKMLLDKVTGFVSSRSLEVTMPKIAPSDLGFEEGRGKGGGGGGGGGKGGGMKGMMQGMMMGMAAKMAALIPIAIAGLFLLAGKALITAKIALLLAGIIAIKKLFAQKNSGGGGHGGGGWQSGGGGGGWQSSGGGGGWDKRSLEQAQNLAYKAYVPQQE